MHRPLASPHPQEASMCVQDRAEALRHHLAIDPSFAVALTAVDLFTNLYRCI